MGIGVYPGPVLWYECCMKIYHGTSAAAAERIALEGIRPRATDAGNWTRCPSHPGLVYLTECYAPFFALACDDDEIAIVEVELSALDVDRMRPDEDFLEQAARAHPENARMMGLADARVPNDLAERTVWFRQRIDSYADLWKRSLDMLGCCSHAGIVPPEAISRIAVLPVALAPRVVAAIDPSITMMNYRIMGDFYRELTRWFFDEDARPEQHAPYIEPGDGGFRDRSALRRIK